MKAKVVFRGVVKDGQTISMRQRKCRQCGIEWWEYTADPFGTPEMGFCGEECRLAHQAAHTLLPSIEDTP